MQNGSQRFTEAGGAFTDERQLILASVVDDGCLASENLLHDLDVVA